MCITFNQTFWRFVIFEITVRLCLQKTKLMMGEFAILLVKYSVFYFLFQHLGNSKEKTNHISANTTIPALSAKQQKKKWICWLCQIRLSAGQLTYTAWTVTLDMICSKGNLLYLYVMLFQPITLTQNFCNQMFFTDILEEFNEQTLLSSWFGIIKNLERIFILKGLHRRNT